MVCLADVTRHSLEIVSYAKVCTDTHTCSSKLDADQSEKQWDPDVKHRREQDTAIDTFQLIKTQSVAAAGRCITLMKRH